eukprot:1147154-Pelagomonas_calceolata.AAC.3
MLLPSVWYALGVAAILQQEGGGWNLAADLAVQHYLRHAHVDVWMNGHTRRHIDSVAFTQKSRL